MSVQWPENAKLLRFLVYRQALHEGAKMKNTSSNFFDLGYQRGPYQPYLCTYQGVRHTVHFLKSKNYPQIVMKIHVEDTSKSRGMTFEPAILSPIAADDNFVPRPLFDRARNQDGVLVAII